VKEFDVLDGSVTARNRAGYKLSDVVSDIVLCRIAEEIELRARFRPFALTSWSATPPFSKKS